ncbi:MAG TPA: vWA domain-containing protein, partial [Thermodesulfovibrionia bacterium]|nr:vWA domain-containing protein [Thermodesulfovibrionia bacterium]
GKTSFGVKDISNTRPMISSGNRDQFINSVKSLPYDAKMTYFYPGLKRAIDDLAAQSGDVYATRVVVLVTDGLPEQWAQEEEKNLFESELITLLQKYNIRLYVLAFGPSVVGSNFLDSIKSMLNGSSTGQFLGDVLAKDVDGSQLLPNMSQIFAVNFGFTVDPKPSGSIPGAEFKLKLRENEAVEPDRLAVAIFSPTPIPVSTFELSHSSGKINNPTGIQNADEKGGSYAIRWYVKPIHKDLYDLKTNISSGSYAIFRPIRVELEVRKYPASDNKLLESVMAVKNDSMPGTPFDIVVKPQGGTLSDPGDVDISFQLTSKTWKSSKLESPDPAPTFLQEGRAYKGTLRFPENKQNPAKLYKGKINITAKKGQAPVDAGEKEVEVYPYLSITPFASTDTLGKPMAKGDQEECADEFTFQKDGYLPDKLKQIIRAVIAPDKQIAKRELYQAELTLEGKKLEFANNPGPTNDWYKGIEFTKEELEGKRSLKLCVRKVKPKFGSKPDPFEVPVKFTLVDHPYDDFNVFKDYTLRMQVTPPSPWPLLGMLTVFLFALAALFWYTRSCPDLPPDLRYALAFDGTSPKLEPKELGQGTFISRLLRFVVDRPVIIDNQEVAWVHPVKDTNSLYMLKLAKGVTIEAVQKFEPIPFVGKLANIEIHKTYRLITGENKRYLFRLEYNLDAK